MMSPKKVILLAKTNCITAGVLAAYQAMNAVRNSPEAIQP